MLNKSKYLDNFWNRAAKIEPSCDMDIFLSQLLSSPPNPPSIPLLRRPHPSPSARHAASPPLTPPPREQHRHIRPAFPQQPRCTMSSGFTPAPRVTRSRPRTVDWLGYRIRTSDSTAERTHLQMSSYGSTPRIPPCPIPKNAPTTIGKSCGGHRIQCRRGIPAGRGARGRLTSAGR